MQRCVRDRCKEATDSERASLGDRRVHRPGDMAEVKACGPSAVLVDCRWLLHRKPTGRVKARMVARQVKHSVDDMDTFAATATTTGARLLLGLTAWRNAEAGERGKDWCVSFGDVKTAFLHASLPDSQHVFLQPPRTEGEGHWRAPKALYGLRQAPRLFLALIHI